MPITYDEANDIWGLAAPSDAEKEALVKIAIFDITTQFGAEVASRIIKASVEGGYHMPTGFSGDLGSVGDC